MTHPIRPTDNEARQLAHRLLYEARFASLAVLDAHKSPFVSRIAFGLTASRTPLSLISTLSHHTNYMIASKDVSLLIGEPLAKGDPLTYPRMTLQARAEFIARTEPKSESLKETWLKLHPKSQLYIDFTDFKFILFSIQKAYLNGGFGKAYILSAEDLKSDKKSGFRKDNETHQKT
ncbi:MAG: pyridoxamine 5-phosphate oxidase [Aestuariivita sp.]|nr:pyridoxamine 5-phosphate oxidase [Aestuariivita sp.]